MKAVDFSRWAVVAYNDDTGLGRMAADARSVLGLGRQIVIPSERLETKPLEPADLLLTEQTPEAELRQFLDDLDGLIFLEKPNWAPTLLPIAKELGLPVVAVPMWEWLNVREPLWRYCDAMFCPNERCLRIVRKYGFENARRATWPLDLSRLPKRMVTGPARVFTHNAGLVDRDDRKGTREVIEAFRRVKGSGLRLKVRVQRAAELPEVDERISVEAGNVADLKTLWAEGEVAVQPSKLEGIGFMVLEPICSGIPTITLNTAPQNEYHSELLVQPRWFSRRGYATQWMPDARLRVARVSSLARQIENCSKIDLSAISQRQRAWAEETFAPEKLRREWAELLSKLPARRGALA